MRKVLSFVLVLALVLGSFASVFAATENKLAVGVRTVAEETVFGSGLEFKVNNNAGFEDAPTTLRLSIENGEWASDKDDYGSNSDVLAANASDYDASTTTGPAIYIDMSGVTGPEPTVTVESLTQTSVELQFTPVNNTPLAKDDVVIIYFKIESGNDVGDVTVKAEGDGDFNSGSYVVATVVGGKTVATVTESPKRSGRATGFSAATIEIRETSIGVVSGSQSVVLRLPKGVEWNSATSVSGSMGATSGRVLPDTDSREYEISFTPSGNTSARRSLVIQPVINITKDASKGDIEVDVRVSGSNKLIDDASGLIIAIYGDENVNVTTVKDSDLPEIVSGFEKQTNGKPYILEVTLEEELPDSLVGGRYIDFKLPEYVQLAEKEYVKVKANSGSMTATSITGNASKDNSEFEWQVPTAPTLRTGRTNKFAFEIPVTVEAGYEGDIELEISGGRAGINDTTLVVATAIAPVKVEAQLADVRTGVQNQTTTDIVIKENLIGGIRDEKNENVMEVYLDDPTGSNMDFKDAEFKVTGGDLEIKSAKIEKGIMKITIDGSSRKTASEITISGVEVTLDRTPAEGKYELAVGGDAVVNNAHYNDKEFAGAAVKVDYLNIITPADANVYGEANFVIGKSVYSVLVNGVLEERTMDVAPYIDSNSRTMVPMRYVANALGVSDDNIIWNQDAQTATFFKGDRVAVITAGSNQMSVNGAIVTMDTVAVVKDNRVYVPMRYVANALGGTVDWKQETQTVTINQ